jgi:glycosyltransferase involved in cell wall biosynthesis
LAPAELERDCVRVAIGLCTFKRPQSLDRLLSELERSDLGDEQPWRAFCVIVDNHPDGTARDVCERHRPRLPVPLFFAEEPQQGISFARNRAVREAVGHGADFIAFIDDDDVPYPDWLRQIMAKQQETSADLVFGSRTVPADLAIPDWLKEISLFQPPNVDKTCKFGLPEWAGTYNVLIACRLIQEMAPDGLLFMPEFARSGGGDTDFFIRAVRLGAAYARAPESLVVRNWEPDRLTLRGIMRRAFRLGLTRVAVERRHLAPDEFKARRRRRLRTMAEALRQLLMTAFIFGERRKPSMAAALFSAASQWGELYAYFGREYRYY